MAKRRGHYCYVCGRMRPNEKFSGKGHAKHICRDCQKKEKKVKKEETARQETLERICDLFGDELILLDVLDDCDDNILDETDVNDFVFDISEDDLPF